MTVFTQRKLWSIFKEEKFMDEFLKELDEFHSQILWISGTAKDFIAKNGVNALLSDIQYISKLMHAQELLFASTRRSSSCG